MMFKRYKMIYHFRQIRNKQSPLSIEQFFYDKDQQSMQDVLTK